MNKRVVIVDYGVGNLYSVSKAFEWIDVDVLVSGNAKEISGADYLVLPGVGAFGHAIRRLEKNGLIDGIKEQFRTNRPFLGICVGMQLMLSQGMEFGTYEGLGFINGTVEKISNVSKDGKSIKIPHIGWNKLESTHGGSENHNLLSGLPHESFVYFVHSYSAKPEDDAKVLSTCNYGGHALTALIGDGNAFGCQFHPEKSGEIGLQILKNFISL